MFDCMMFALMIHADRIAAGDGQTRISRPPREVALFIDRRIDCNHWAGEEGGEDIGRRREIEGAIKALRCDRIDEDERALHKKYEMCPEILRLILEN